MRYLFKSIQLRSTCSSLLKYNDAFLPSNFKRSSSSFASISSNKTNPPYKLFELYLHFLIYNSIDLKDVLLPLENFIEYR